MHSKLTAIKIDGQTKLSVESAVRLKEEVADVKVIAKSNQKRLLNCNSKLLSAENALVIPF